MWTTGTIEVVALVDIDPAALEYGARALGLPDRAVSPTRTRRSMPWRPISAPWSCRRIITRPSLISPSHMGSTC